MKSFDPPAPPGGLLLPAFSKRPLLRRKPEWLVCAWMMMILAGVMFSVFQDTLPGGGNPGRAALMCLAWVPVCGLVAWYYARTFHSAKSPAWWRARGEERFSREGLRVGLTIVLLLGLAHMFLPYWKMKDVPPGLAWMLAALPPFEALLVCWLLRGWWLSAPPRVDRLWLQSFEYAGETAVLDTAAGTLTPWAGEVTALSGIYSVDGAGRVHALLLWGGKLVLLTGERWLELKDVPQPGPDEPVARGFTVRRGGRPPLSVYFDYTPRVDAERLADDPAPSPLPEHASFPHFVAAALNHAGHALRRNWADGQLLGETEILPRHALRTRQYRGEIPGQDTRAPRRFSPDVLRALLEAGWHEGRTEGLASADAITLADTEIHAAGRAVLGEFGGLIVQPVREGTAASPERPAGFMGGTREAEKKRHLLEACHAATGLRLIPAASIRPEVSWLKGLAVDEEGRVFHLTDESIFYFSPGFDDAVERLLRGLPYAPVPPALEPGCWLWPESGERDDPDEDVHEPARQRVYHPPPGEPSACEPGPPAAGAHPVPALKSLGPPAPSTGLVLPAFLKLPCRWAFGELRLYLYLFLLLLAPGLFFFVRRTPLEGAFLGSMVFIFGFIMMMLSSAWQALGWFHPWLKKIKRVPRPWQRAGIILTLVILPAAGLWLLSQTSASTSEMEFHRVFAAQGLILEMALVWWLARERRRSVPLMLQSFEYAAETLAVDPRTGRLLPYEGRDPVLSGVFSVDGGGRVHALLRWEERLVLLTGGHAVAVDGAQVVPVEGAGLEHGFTLRVTRWPDFFFTYIPREDGARLADIPLPFPVGEYVSFPRFLAGVLGEKLRMWRLGRYWRDGSVTPGRMAWRGACQRTRASAGEKAPYPHAPSSRFSPAVHRRLLEAGWYEGRREAPGPRWLHAQSRPLPAPVAAVLAEFGELNIEAVDEGHAAAPRVPLEVSVSFDRLNAGLLAACHAATGFPLFRVASCGCEEPEILMDERGRVFQLEPGLRFGYHAPTFEEALERTLQGLPPAPCPPDLAPGSWPMPEDMNY